jgi:hypothetical protein
MAGETENRSRIAASRVQIADVREGHGFTLESQRCQALGENQLATGIVRRDGTATQQCRQQGDARVLGVCAVLTFSQFLITHVII